MKNQQSRKAEKRKPEDLADEMTRFRSVRTDPQGSYTGRPADRDEVPVQDADDL